MATELQIAEALEVLNRVHAVDPSVLPALIAQRVPCNRALVDDPTVQVGNCIDGWDSCEVGLLGILNGIFGARPHDGKGYIAANYDEDGTLVSFIETPG